MNITEQELAIGALYDVARGSIPQMKTVCRDRRSDGFVYILSGEARYSFSDGWHERAQAGDILFLSHHSRYEIDVPVKDYTFIYVDFFFEKTDGILQNRVYRSRAFEKLQSIFIKCNRLYHTGSLENTLICKSLVYKIYAEIVAAQTSTYLSVDKRHLLEEAVAYISEHYAERTLSVAQLASRAGVSEVYFRRLFGEGFRTSPIRFITAYRLGVARELLLSTTIPVGEIATLCGFETSYYFARVFKAQFGVTPNAYRQKK